MPTPPLPLHDDDHLLEQLLALPTVLNAQISPDRRWIAFVWYRVHANLDVFLVPTDGSQPPYPLTNTPEETVLVSWSPDSQAVVVAEDHDGDERARLFRVAIERPLVLEPLTEDRPEHFLRGGELSADGQHLFYLTNYDVANQRPIEASWIYAHDLASGSRTALVQLSRPTWGVPHLSPQGDRLLFPAMERHPGAVQYRIVDRDGRNEREILHAGPHGKLFAGWLPDGERLAILTESKDGSPQSHRSVGVYHLASATTEWLIDDPTRNIEAIHVSRDGLICVDEVRQARHLPEALDPTSGAKLALPPLPSGNTQLLGRAPDGAWLALNYSSTTPPDLVRIGADGQVQSLTRYHERLPIALERLISAEDFRWQSVDGIEIQGWLYRATPNPQRAIIYVHGGPTAHSEERLSPQIQYFVARGFNVLDVNYRGSTGFDLAYRESIKEDGWGGREQADIAEGARALIAAGLAAPGCIGVTGTSYGGYSAWHQIVHTPVQLIAAAAPICGMTDLVIDYETTRPDLRPYSEEMIGGRPDEIPAKYAERSPIHYVHQIRGSLLIVQGAMDPNVTPENVTMVRRQLDAAAIPYELLEFADEGHGIVKPSNQRQLYRRLVDFFSGALEAD